jgi:hypothetical protein
MRLWPALALLALAAAPAAARDRPTEACVANPGLAACTDALARAYGVPTIDAHLAAGDTVLRVFFVEGRGENRLLIAFVRAAGREPTAFVYFPRGEGSTAPAPMQAQLPAAIWDEAFSRAAYADRSFLPEPPEEMLCLDDWTFVFEASEPARMGSERPGRTRRHAVGNCEPTPLLPFVWDLQRLALPLFPVCEALSLPYYRGPAAAFRQCPILSGDRLAAAKVVTLSAPFEGVFGSRDGDALGSLFVYNATINWNGRRNRPNDGIAHFWLAQVARDQADDFVVESAVGLSVDRVRLTGYLGRTVRERRRTIHYRAPFEQLWAQNMIVAATIGPWTVQRGD